MALSKCQSVKDESPHAYILYINIIYNYILYINITTKREATRKRPITFFDVFDIFDTLTSNHQSLRRFYITSQPDSCGCENKK